MKISVEPMGRGNLRNKMGERKTEVVLKLEERNERVGSFCRAGDAKVCAKERMRDGWHVR
jgi:hypothetical protein